MDTPGQKGGKGYGHKIKEKFGMDLVDQLTPG